MALSQDQLPVLVYDGDCAFCSSTVRLLGRALGTACRAVPWQEADLEGLKLSQQDCERAVQWVGPARERAEGAAAVAAVLVGAHNPLAQAVGRLLGRPRAARAAARLYGVVAANRHRLLAGNVARLARCGQLRRAWGPIMGLWRGSRRR